MSYCRTLVFIVACALGIFAGGDNVLLADPPNIVSYQGRLTTPAGQPVVNGNYPIVFTIYDALGTPLWASGIQTVAVTDGLFSYLLGSTNPIPDSLFVSVGEAIRYLGIKVGSDPEIIPRTRLGSVPFASTAARVSGDVETSEGKMEINKSTGSAGISFELELDPASRAYQAASFKMFDPQPEPPGKMIEMRTSASQGPQISLFRTLSGSSDDLLSIGYDPELGGSNITMYSALSKAGGSPVLKLIGNQTRGGSLVMFDPQPEPPGVLFNLNATSASGPSMSFFNQAGQVMGIEPVPWNTGFSIKMFDPQPEPPGVLLDLTTVVSSSSSASIAMHSRNISGSTQMVGLSSAGGAGELLLGPGTALKATGPVVRCYSGSSNSTVEILGPTGAAPAPPIYLSSTATAARVGIGTGTPSQALHVVGNICYTGTIGACSDGAFKKDIEPIENALIKIDRLSGVRYSWRADEFPDYRFSNERQVGVVAQQVREVLPEAVTCQPDGYYTVDYSRLTPLLIEAIKELKRENEQLTRRLETLEQAKR